MGLVRARDRVRPLGELPGQLVHDRLVGLGVSIGAAVHLAAVDAAPDQGVDARRIPERVPRPGIAALLAPLVRGRNPDGATGGATSRTFLLSGSPRVGDHVRRYLTRVG